MKFPMIVGVSARHAHLCREHMDILFGKDSELHVKKAIGQPGQFASLEQIVMVTPKGETELTAEERLYRAVAYMTMTNELIKLFNDYNQARRDAKGEETAASKFIGNDINEVIQLLSAVRGNNRVLTDERYMGVQDKVFTLIEYMTGRRDLPMGKGFGEAIRETQEAIQGYVREVEPLWRDAYTPLITELVQQARANDNKIGPAPADEAK